MMHDSRLGKLLVAHPLFPRESPFSRTVIYIYQDDSVNGTTGVVINKPSRTTVQELCEQTELGFRSQPKKMVYMGGPVNKSALVMLHSDDWYSQNTASAGNNLRISSDTFMLHKMADGTNQPAYWKLFVGTSNWAPGQLTAEINGTPPFGPRGMWLTCQADEAIMFDTDGDELWHTALDMCSQQTIDQFF